MEYLESLFLIAHVKVIAQENALDKGNGSVSIKLKSAARKKLKPGNYIVSYQVAMKDAAINSKPKTLKMTITVK